MGGSYDAVARPDLAKEMKAQPEARSGRMHMLLVLLSPASSEISYTATAKRLFSDFLNPQYT